MKQLLEPFQQVLSETDWQDFQQKMDAVIQIRVQKSFSGIFESTRKKLAGEQRKNLFRKVYPTVEEIEQFSNEELTKILEARFQNHVKEVLLEENHQLLRTELIAPVIASGRLQQTLQMEMLSRQTIPQDLWFPEEIQKYSAADLEKSIAAKIPENERFPLFPNTRTQIQLKASKIPVERCMHFLPEKLDLETYRQAVSEHPAEHRNPKISREQFAPVLQQQMLQEALRKVGMPEELKPVYAGNVSLQEAVKKAFEQHIVPDMNRIRRMIAEKQRSDFWPALVSGVWQPSFSEIERFAESGRKTIPAPLSGKPEKDSGHLLDETLDMINQLILQRLQKGITLLENQQKQEKQIYDRLLEDMSAMRRSR